MVRAPVLFHEGRLNTRLVPELWPPMCHISCGLLGLQLAVSNSSASPASPVFTCTEMAFSL